MLFYWVPVYRVILPPLSKFTSVVLVQDHDCPIFTGVIPENMRESHVSSVGGRNNQCKIKYKLYLHTQKKMCLQL